MKKKLVVLLTSLVLGLSACSKENNNEEKNGAHVSEKQSETKGENKENTKKEAQPKLNEDEKMAKEYFEKLKKGEVDLAKTWIPSYLKEGANEGYFKELLNTEEFRKLLEGEFSANKMGQLPYDIVEMEGDKQIKISDYFDIHKTMVVNEFMNPLVNGVRIKDFVKDPEKNKGLNLIGYNKPNYGNEDGIDARGSYQLPYLLKKGNKISVEDPIFGKVEKEVDPNGYFDNKDTFSIDRDIFLLPEQFTDERVEKEARELITNFLKAYEKQKPLDGFFEKGTDPKVFEEVFNGIYGSSEAQQFQKPRGFNTRLEEFELLKFNYHSDGTIYARIKLKAKYDYPISEKVVANYGGGENRYPYLLLNYDKADGKPVFSKLNQEKNFKATKMSKEEAQEEL